MLVRCEREHAAQHALDRRADSAARQGHQHRAPSRDLVAILQALKAAGSLDADLEVL